MGTVLTPGLDETESKALLTVCPCVESSLRPSAYCGILGPSPVVFHACRLYAVSKSYRLGGWGRPGTYLSQLWHRHELDAWCR